MPVQTDTPSGLGSSCTGWGLWGSATSKLKALETNNGDTSVIFASSGGRLCLDLYDFPLLAGVVDPVNSASLTSITRLYLKGAGGRSYYAYWNGGQVGSDRAAAVGTTYTYKTVTYSATGAELAVAAVNGEHGWSFSAAGGPSNKAEVWMTQMYRTVDFNYGSGSGGDFAHLVGCLVGTLIGANLLLRDMPALSRAMGRIRLRPDEYVLAWNEWRNYRHPVYGV